MDSIEPFDYSGLIDFDMSYLSGHSAIRYDVSGDEVLGRVKARTFEDAEKLFSASITGYSSVNILSKEFDITSISSKNVMLPVWFMSYYYKDKMYYYAMNGQTGKFGGTLPFDKGKLLVCSVLLPLIILFLAALLFAFI